MPDLYQGFGDSVSLRWPFRVFTTMTAWHEPDHGWASRSLNLRVAREPRRDAGRVVRLRRGPPRVDRQLEGLGTLDVAGHVGRPHLEGVRAVAGVVGGSRYGEHRTGDSHGSQPWPSRSVSVVATPEPPALSWAVKVKLQGALFQ